MFLELIFGTNTFIFCLLGEIISVLFSTLFWTEELFVRTVLFEFSICLILELLINGFIIIELMGSEIQFLLDDKELNVPLKFILFQ